MASPYSFVDGDFTVAVACGPKLFTCPFAGDPGAYILEQDFMQFRENWAPLPLVQILNTTRGLYLQLTQYPEPKFSNYYLTGESPLQAMDGGVVKWKRMFSQVPANRSEFQSYAAQLPGLSYGIAAGVFAPPGFPPTTNPIIFTNAAIVQVPGTATITTTTAHGFTIGTVIALTYETSIFGIQNGKYTFGATVNGVPTSTTFTFATNVNMSTYSALYVQRAGFARKPLTRVVNSRLDYQYFMPGATGPAQVPIVGGLPLPSNFLVDPSYIPITPVVEIYDQFNNRTDTYSNFTTPSQTDYQTIINNQGWVVAEPTSVTRWRGNIYESVTRYIAAQ